MALCPVNVLTISGNRPCFITGIQKRCPKGDQIWRLKKTRFCKILIFSIIQNLEVPYTEVFSNQLLDDLDKIWELRFFIPDPTDPSKCVVFAE